MPKPGELEPVTVELGGFLMLRFKGTVIRGIWWQVLLVIFYTVGIVLVEFDVPSLYMNFPDTLVDILGLVTSLLLCFRTDTAYERYTEGRELWSRITNSVRSMTREIWLGVREETSRDFVEKRSALKLLVAFVIATKHYLREEYSHDFDDLQDLINHLPRFATPSSVSSWRSQKQRNRRPSTKFSAHEFITPTNIPVEITYYISGYLRSISDRKLADEDALGTMGEALDTFLECLTGFERIQRTPIPLAYLAHLNHSVWIFILALPYQMVGQLGWFTVPSVGLAAFSLLGILAVGSEIENPFGYDTNDLPIDDFCDVMRREIDTVTCSKIIPPQSWIFSTENHPLAPDNLLSAKELSKKTLEEIHDLIGSEAMDKFEPETAPRKRKASKGRRKISEEERKLIQLVMKEHRGDI